MLSPSSPRASVTFKDATLAHIWPSALARESDLLCQQLGLPPAFHVHVRNFLVLDRAVELAFDADALLLLPARAEPPAPPSVRARAFRIELFEHQAAAADGGVAARASIASLAGHELHLPHAGEGRVPFMRLTPLVERVRTGVEGPFGAARGLRGLRRRGSLSGRRRRGRDGLARPRRAQTRFKWLFRAAVSRPHLWPGRTRVTDVQRSARG